MRHVWRPCSHPSSALNACCLFPLHQHHDLHHLAYCIYSQHFTLGLTCNPWAGYFTPLKLLLVKAKCFTRVAFKCFYVFINGTFLILPGLLTFLGDDGDNDGTVRVGQLAGYLHVGD